MNNPLISVVIPVYKAQDVLDELYQRLRTSLESITREFEIILVEDCGGDNSWEIISRLADYDQRVRGIQFSRNFGQHYGITAGLEYSRGDWAVVMDCDLQDRPEEIPRLYAKAMQGYDVVLALRGRRKDSLFKRCSSFLFYKIFRYLTDMDYNGQSGNFRIISRKVVDNYLLMREQLRFFGGLIHWLGFPVAYVHVEHGERPKGASTYTFSKLWKLATETIIAYSDKPLRLTVRLGFFMSLASFCFGFYLTVRSLLFNIPVPGWTSLIVSLYFLGGIIIFILGIIGIYLGKTFDEVKKRPLYILRRKTFE